MKLSRHLVCAAIAAVASGYPALSMAQSGSAASAAARSAAAPSGAPGPEIPMGQGPGVHSPNSPFAPLVPRDDVVPWSVLTKVTIKVEKNRLVPVFDATHLSLNQKTQRIQGFMMPLEPGATQKRFLVSSVPLTCSFCVPGGPEGMVEVLAKTPVKYSMEPVVVEGRFLVLNDDKYGLYYRMTDAVSVK